MKVDDIPVGEGRALVVDGTQVAVFRLRDGSLRAIEAVCPHRGGPLADGLTDDCVVVCPLHGHAFDLTTGAEASGADLAVRSYTAEAVDGSVRVTVSSRSA
jgi:nitrite reductase (NADH) small subunit